LFEKLNHDYSQALHHNISYTYEMLITAFQTVLDKLVPIKKSTRRDLKFKSKPWISRAIIKSIQTKNKMFKNCYKCKNNLMIQRFKSYSNVLTKPKEQQNYYITD